MVHSHANALDKRKPPTPPPPPFSWLSTLPPPLSLLSAPRAFCPGATSGQCASLGPQSAWTGDHSPWKVTCPTSRESHHTTSESERMTWRSVASGGGGERGEYAGPRGATADGLLNAPDLLAASLRGLRACGGSEQRRAEPPRGRLGQRGKGEAEIN